MTKSWQRRFFTFWAAQSVSMIGSSLAQFAITWWLTKATGSATVLATATLVSTLPGVVLGPLAGVLVDRWNRRLLIMLADGVAALGAALLMLLFWAGTIAIWHLYVVAFVRAIAGLFHFSSVQASTSLMVPEEQLARVAGLNQALQGVNMVVAPPLGALLLELLSLPWMMAIDVVTAFIAIGLVFLIDIPQPQVALPSTARPTIWADLGVGLRYIWQWPGLLFVLTLSSLLNFILNPAFSLLPILVTRHFRGNALQFATLDTTLGLGFIAGGLLLSVWGGFRRRIYTVLVGLVGMSLGTLLIGIAPANGYWWAVGGIAIFGVLNPIANGPFMAIVQAVVMPEMQGRFFSVLNSISQAMTPIGLLIAGPVADKFGVQVWFLIGAASLLAMCVIVLCTPAIMYLEEHHYAQQNLPQ
jgi:DHA3 family macrolide efflux protein-like MFS transporter